MHCNMTCAVVLCLLVANLSAGLSSASVLVITKDNLADAVADNDFLLVMFYTEPCANCKVLEPNFEKAADMLAKENSPVRSAKVDCSENVLLESMFHITEYPTLKLLRHGNPLKYNGAKPTHELKPQSIVHWAKANINSGDQGSTTVNR